MANIMNDIAILHKAVRRSQEGKDALNRLIEYNNTLEVQKGYLTDFIDDSRVTNRFGASVETLRALLADAEQNVDGNYGLLETAEEQCVAAKTVEGTVEEQEDGSRFFATQREHDDYYEGLERQRIADQIASETLQTLKSLKVVDHNLVAVCDETCFDITHIEMRD